MIQSMTAFSQVHHQSESLVLTWELRSLNHRYLDVTFRMPESLKYLEVALRQCLREKITRGKLEFNLKLSEEAAGQSALFIQDQLIQRLLEEAHRVSAAFGIADDIKLSQVLSWPGVIAQKAPVYQDLAPFIEQLFQEGLTHLLEAKRAEGLVLEVHIQKRLVALRQEILAARAQTDLQLQAAREKIALRLSELQMKVEDSRIEQELALLLIRFDVAEELDRLDTHVNEVERTLQLGEASGKRLDFLMQELNREANTLGSKSNSVKLSQHAIQMKVFIEQMREQIQNIE